MEPGTIVEYIDRKQIVCAVVLGRKNQKLRMLTEHNREISHAEKRLAHVTRERLDPGIGRDALVNRLQNTVATRRQLQKQIDVEALWGVPPLMATSRATIPRLSCGHFLRIVFISSSTPIDFFQIAQNG
jgi:hypothetical protein